MDTTILYSEAGIATQIMISAEGNHFNQLVEILYKIKKHPKGEEIFKDGRK